MGRERDFWTEEETGIVEKVNTPRMYKVILHNDDYTTMEFVVEILMDIFNKDNIRANEIMLDVHRKGKGICGVYTYDIAVTKVEQVRVRAEENQFPLRCSCEEE